MPKFIMTELVPSDAKVTARLGAGTGAANQIDDKEVGKAVKLIADSQFDLCAAGDPIEGFINSVESASVDNYSLGAIQNANRKEVTFDGLEATPGTGVVAVGDFVVMGTAVAKGTALTIPNRVTKATNQPGAPVVSTVATDDLAASAKVALDAALVKVADAAANSLAAWRVVSLGSAGTGAVGSAGVIERVHAA